MNNKSHNLCLSRLICTINWPKYVQYIALFFSSSMCRVILSVLSKNYKSSFLILQSVSVWTGLSFILIGNQNEKRCSGCPVWPRQPHSSSKLPCPLTPHISSPPPHHMASLGLRTAWTTTFRLYFVGLLQALLQTLLYVLIVTTVFAFVVANLPMEMALSSQTWTFSDLLQL